MLKLFRGMPQYQAKFDNAKANVIKSMTSERNFGDLSGIWFRARKMGENLLLEVQDRLLILRMGKIHPHPAVRKRPVKPFRHIIHHRVQHDLSGGCGGACLVKSVQLFPLNLQHRL